MGAAPEPGWVLSPCPTCRNCTWELWALGSGPRLLWGCPDSCAMEQGRAGFAHRDSAYGNLGVEKEMGAFRSEPAGKSHVPTARHGGGGSSSTTLPPIWAQTGQDLEGSHLLVKRKHGGEEGESHTTPAKGTLRARDCPSPPGREDALWEQVLECHG